MAVLTVFLKNGDILAFGTNAEQTSAAYDALLSSGTEYVEFGTIFTSSPRFAIRKSEVVNIIHDPNDNGTIFASSALFRAQKLQMDVQEAANEVSPPAVPSTAQPGSSPRRRQ